MPLSIKAKQQLVSALGFRKANADEFEAALFIPAPLSDALKKNIHLVIPLKDAADEVIHALETGSQVLSDRTILWFKYMMASGSPTASAEILALLSTSSEGILGLLGAALAFGVFGSSVSNSGLSAIYGDAGAATTIAGLNGQVSGSTHAGDPTAAAAAAAISDTYANLVARVPTADLSGQNLGGMVLAPGVYNYAAASNLTGTLTLDAGGNPNAVFIIKVGANFTAAAAAAVVLAGGATADNVFWQVAGTANIGAGAGFIGNILADSDITLGAGATTNGRILSVAGAVTLASNSIVPTPVAPSAPPAAPLGVTAVGGFEQITPSWGTVLGATSYNLYWNTTGAPTKADTKITGATSGVAITGLVDGTHYYYVATAVNANGESDISAAVSATARIATPTGLAAVAGNTQVSLSWNPVTGATGYNIYFNTTGAPTTASTKLASVTSPYVHTGRTNGTHYYYVVTAVDAGSESPISAAVSAIPAASATLIQSIMGVSTGFELLAGTTVSNTGVSNVTGDVGVFPGTAVVTGPWVLTGNIHANDGAAAQAQSDLTAAYNALAGMAMDTNLSGQDLGGLAPLIPGVYKFNTAAQLTGTLVLNGNATDRWIFQIGTTLTTATSAVVSLTGGAISDNVCWQVGTSATIGIGTDFKGNIIADASVTIVSTASIEGRALARSGGVTLDTNICTL